MTSDLTRPQPGPAVIETHPSGRGFRYLDFSVLELRAGESHRVDTTGREAALVTLTGAGNATVDGNAFALSRLGVFEEAANLLYLPPGLEVLLSATEDWHVALGTAPAEGRYPLRLVTPDEIKRELRGGGTAIRQVNHLLSHPLPAERLIVYEVFVPGGAWAGWPPHCHDGNHGSPYLEETYYFRFDRADGFGFHRNYLNDGSYDAVYTVRDGDCVAVPRGFHITAAAPGHNMWILNFLAGKLVDEARATPSYFDPATTWIVDDWARGQITLPVMGTPQ